MTLDSRTEEKMRQARRRFLMSCGKFAVVTPPAVTLLLAGERQNYAAAGSHLGNAFGTRGRREFGLGHADNGFGNGGGDGVPGRSDHSDVNR